MRAALSTTLALLAALGGCKGGPPDDTQDVDTWVFDTDVVDCDGDDDGVCADDGDCDDADPAVHPGRTEDCNGVDDNCNDVVDEGLPDADGDGTCDAMDAETCDGLDNDGDGDVDEDFGDGDGDGVADCADGEECDGVDNDGDGDVDEGYDADADGFTQCGGDCDDADAARNPDETEDDGDAIDNDCDGFVDEGAWGVADVYITEIMNNPVRVSDPNGEWFEIVNASTRTIVLNGLAIGDSSGERHQIDPGKAVLTLAPGEYFVLGSNGNRATNGGVDVDYVTSGISLGNGADDLRLWVETASGDLVVDEVAWDGGAAFPNPTNGSMTLEPTYSSAVYNDDGAYWCEAPEAWGLDSDRGSPGEANALCTSFDHDGDGYTVDDGDCNDADDSVFPGAPETDPTVDNDCDDVVEQGPTAVAVLGTGSSAEECGEIVLDGTGSTDPNTPLSYEWELVSAPMASAKTSADIVDPTAATASLVPDVDGVYTFSLTVWDSGGAASVPDTLTVTVTDRTTNTPPVAEAGVAQTQDGTSSCTPLSYGTSGYDCEACDDHAFTLDGTASSDPDGDTLSYQWKVVSGAGSVTGAASSKPTVTVSGAVPPTKAGEATETVTVQLVVTDCMGAPSPADTVVLTYTCTGK